MADTIGLELTLICWPVGLYSGLVDNHSNLAETDASVSRVPFIVGNAPGINFENLLCIAQVVQLCQVPSAGLG